jgi:hypothetical protein
MNLPVRFGVPLLPSHKFQPVGIAEDAPDHIRITPDGIPEIPVSAEPSMAGNAPVRLPDVKLVSAEPSPSVGNNVPVAEGNVTVVFGPVSGAFKSAPPEVAPLIVILIL